MTMASPFYFVGTAMLLLVFLSQAADFLIPIAIAFLVWFMINAFADALVRHLPFIGRISWLPVFVASLLIMLMVGLAGSAIFSTFAQLSTDLARATLKIETFINELLMTFDISTKFSVPERIEASLSEILKKIIDSVQLIASDGSTIIIYVLFLFADQPFFSRKLKAIIPNETRRTHVEAVLKRISDDVRTYMYLMTLMSLLTGFATYCICLWFDVPAAIFWAFLAFILNYIPTVGTILGVGFPTVFALATFSNPDSVIALGVTLFVMQFLIGNILLPKLMGSQLDISQFVVILSLFGWAAVWGITGMLLSVPLTVIIMIVLYQFPSTRQIGLALSKTGKPIVLHD